MSIEPLSETDWALPALLTVWPNCVATKAVEPRAVPSLRAAVDEAIAVLRAETGAPWIITGEGLILTPAALRCLMEAPLRSAGP